MTRFEVTMTGSVVGSPQAHIVQIESLLHSFSTTHANDNMAPPRSRRFDGRPLVAACLAFFVFAPGCAAAAAFLLRSDGSVPPLVTPASNPPLIAKSDRLPLEQWSAEASESLGAQQDVRAAAAMIAEDAKFLQPMVIRGSLEDGTITAFAEATPADVAMATAPTVTEATPATAKPRAKRHARRTPPIRVAEAPPIPEPPEPTFLEKLFGTRFN
jgi:hypothetical protein